MLRLFQLKETGQRFDGRLPNQHRPICMWLRCIFII